MIDSLRPQDAPAPVRSAKAAGRLGAGREEADRDSLTISDLARRLQESLADGHLTEGNFPRGVLEAAQLQETLSDARVAGDAADVFGIVDSFLNLGPESVFPQDVTREEMGEALKVLADLLKRGVVGYEYRKINGQRHKVFIDVAIGSDMARAPLWRGSVLDDRV